MAVYAPQWLEIADVKAWLRLNDQDNQDDDLLTRVAAMAEPYVQRCRPEWRVPVVLEAALRADAEYYSAQTVVRVDEWQTAHPDHQLVDQRGHVVRLYVDPGDTWGVIDPNQVVQVLFTTGMGALEALPLLDAVTGQPVTTREASAWVTQRQLLVLTAVGDTHFTVNAAVTDYQPDGETYQGAVMYAAREYRRRNSPAGIEMFGDVTSFVSRYDPDIDRALQTGAYARPVVS